MLRLFVGLDLPGRVRDRLAMIQAGVPGARWVRPEGLHVTLRFIGEVAIDVAADIDAELGRLTAGGFTLRIGGVGQFGTARRAEMLWAGVERSEPLQFLHDKVDRALVAAGLPAGDRKFKPHITLGRLKNAPADRVMRWLTDYAPFQTEPVAVEHFVLFRSHLGNQGSVYEELAVYDLAGNSDRFAADQAG